MVAIVISNILSSWCWHLFIVFFPCLLKFFLILHIFTYSRYLETRLWDFLKFFGECFLLFCFSRQLTQIQARGSNLPFSVGFGSNVSPVCISAFGIIPACTLLRGLTGNLVSGLHHSLALKAFDKLFRVRVTYHSLRMSSGVCIQLYGVYLPSPFLYESLILSWLHPHPHPPPPTPPHPPLPESCGWMDG